MFFAKNKAPLIGLIFITSVLTWICLSLQGTVKSLKDIKLPTDVHANKTVCLPNLTHRCPHEKNQMKNWENFKINVLQDNCFLKSTDTTNFKVNTGDVNKLGDTSAIFNKIMESIIKYSKLSDVIIIIEVGSFKGKSTISMANQCNEDARPLGKECIIISIDAWTWPAEEALQSDGVFKTFATNIKMYDLTDKVFPLRMPVYMAGHVLHCHQIEADIIFIDASHSYKDVILDLDLYYPLLKKGGIIYGDDYAKTHRPGVSQALKEFTQERKLKFDTYDRYWYFTKEKEDSKFFSSYGIRVS